MKIVVGWTYRLHCYQESRRWETALIHSLICLGNMIYQYLLAFELHATILRLSRSIGDGKPSCGILRWVIFIEDSWPHNGQLTVVTVWLWCSDRSLVIEDGCIFVCKSGRSVGSTNIVLWIPTWFPLNFRLKLLLN